MGIDLAVAFTSQMRATLCTVGPRLRHACSHPPPPVKSYDLFISTSSFHRLPSPHETTVFHIHNRRRDAERFSVLCCQSKAGCATTTSVRPATHIRRRGTRVQEYEQHNPKFSPKYTLRTIRLNAASSRCAAHAKPGPQEDQCRRVHHHPTTTVSWVLLHAFDPIHECCTDDSQVLSSNPAATEQSARPWLRTTEDGNAYCARSTVD